MNKQNVGNKVNTLMSNYLKKKRCECGLSGKELGQLLCISQQHVSRYERGETVIPLGIMIYFLQYFQFSLDDFFNYLLEGVYVSYEKNEGINYQHFSSESLIYQSKGFIKTN